LLASSKALGPAKNNPRSPADKTGLSIIRISIYNNAVIDHKHIYKPWPSCILLSILHQKPMAATTQNLITTKNPNGFALPGITLESRQVLHELLVDNHEK
jgi:hypothetical protein